MRFLTILLCSLSAYAAEPGVSGPVLGYVFEEGSASIRPILGAPGAAVVAEPLPVDTTISAAWIAPGRAFAMVRLAESGELAALNLTTMERTILAPAVDRVRFSPRAVISAVIADNRVSLFDQALQPVASAALPSGTLDVAVSDDGKAILAFAADGLYRVTPDEEPALLWTGALSAIAFYPGTHDALLAESGDRVLLHKASGEIALFTSVHADYVAIVQRVILLNTTSRTVSTAAPDGSDLRSMSCDFELAALTSLAENAFLLSPAQASPAWLLDTAPLMERIVFAPRAQPAEQEVTQ